MPPMPERDDAGHGGGDRGDRGCGPAAVPRGVADGEPRGQRQQPGEPPEQADHERREQDHAQHRQDRGEVMSSLAAAGPQGAVRRPGDAGRQQQARRAPATRRRSGSRRGARPGPRPRRCARRSVPGSSAASSALSRPHSGDEAMSRGGHLERAEHRVAEPLHQRPGQPRDADAARTEPSDDRGRPEHDAAGHARPGAGAAARRRSRPSGPGPAAAGGRRRRRPARPAARPRAAPSPRRARAPRPPRCRSRRRTSAW